jgi:hypothetical protein
VLLGRAQAFVPLGGRMPMRVYRGVKEDTLQLPDDFLNAAQDSFAGSAEACDRWLNPGIGLCSRSDRPASMRALAQLAFMSTRLSHPRWRCSTRVRAPAPSLSSISAWPHGAAIQFLSQCAHAHEERVAANHPLFRSDTRAAPRLSGFRTRRSCSSRP